MTPSTTSTFASESPPACACLSLGYLCLIGGGRQFFCCIGMHQIRRPSWSPHLLDNFGVYPETTLKTYHASCNKSGGKSKRNDQAAHTQAKCQYITRNTLPIGDMIKTMNIESARVVAISAYSSQCTRTILRALLCLSGL